MAILTGDSAGRRFIEGNGTPNGAVVGSRGDIYSQKDGTPGNTFWIKDSGDATNTGWAAIATSAISGSGTVKKLAVFTGANTIGDSIVRQNGFFNENLDVFTSVLTVDANVGTFTPTDALFRAISADNHQSGLDMVWLPSGSMGRCFINAAGELEVATQTAKKIKFFTNNTLRATLHETTGDWYHTGDTKVDSTSYTYIGDSATNGSWRFYINGTDLVFERRESGTWIEKGAFTA
jgi:hypothetical protein